MWIAFHEQRRIVYVPQKCGSTSFQVAVVPGLREVVEHKSLHTGHAAASYFRSMDMGPLKFHEAISFLKQGYVSLLSVREPIDRFSSIWSYLCNRGNEDPLRRITYGMSPIQFLTFIKSAPFGNDHWWPQYFGSLPDSIPVKFNRLLPSLGYPEVHVHRTTTPKPSLNGEELSLIKEIYAKDFDLWNKSTDNI